MTPDHQLRRLIRQTMLQHDRRHWHFDRQLPRSLREPERKDPPAWLWALIYIAAAFVLWLYGGWV